MLLFNDTAQDHSSKNATEFMDTDVFGSSPMETGTQFGGGRGQSGHEYNSNLNHQTPPQNGRVLRSSIKMTPKGAQMADHGHQFLGRNVSQSSANTEIHSNFNNQKENTPTSPTPTARPVYTTDSRGARPISSRGPSPSLLDMTFGNNQPTMIAARGTSPVIPLEKTSEGTSLNSFSRGVSPASQSGDGHRSMNFTRFDNGQTFNSGQDIFSNNVAHADMNYPSSQNPTHQRSFSGSNNLFSQHALYPPNQHQGQHDFRVSSQQQVFRPDSGPFNFPSPALPSKHLAVPTVNVLPPTPQHIAGQSAQIPLANPSDTPASLTSLNFDFLVKELFGEDNDSASDCIGGRPTQQQQETLASGLIEIIETIKRVSQKSGFTMKFITERLQRRSLRSSGLWNLYQQYFAKHREQELGRLPEEERTPEGTTVPRKTCKKAFELFKLQYGEHAGPLLRVYESLKHLEDGNATMRERDRQFEKFVKDAENLIKEGEAKGFDCIFLSCGRVIHQDQGFSRILYSKCAEEFFLKQMEASDDGVEGVFRAHVFMQSVEDVREEMKANLTSKIEEIDTKNPSQREEESYSSDEPETEKTKKTKKSDQEQDTITELRNLLGQVIKPLGLPTNQTWKGLPAALAKQKYTIFNWPGAITFPNEQGDKKAIAGLKAEERKIFKEAFLAAKNSIVMEKWAKGAMPETTPLIHRLPMKKADPKKPGRTQETFLFLSDVSKKSTSGKKTSKTTNLSDEKDVVESEEDDDLGVMEEKKGDKLGTEPTSKAPQSKRKRGGKIKSAETVEDTDDEENAGAKKRLRSQETKSQSGDMVDNINNTNMKGRSEGKGKEKEKNTEVDEKINHCKTDATTSNSLSSNTISTAKSIPTVTAAGSKTPSFNSPRILSSDLPADPVAPCSGSLAVQGSQFEPAYQRSPSPTTSNLLHPPSQMSFPSSHFSIPVSNQSSAYVESSRNPSPIQSQSQPSNAGTSSNLSSGWMSRVHHTLSENQLQINQSNQVQQDYRQYRQVPAGNSNYSQHGNNTPGPSQQEHNRGMGWSQTRDNKPENAAPGRPYSRSGYSDGRHSQFQQHEQRLYPNEEDFNNYHSNHRTSSHPPPEFTRHPQDFSRPPSDHFHRPPPEFTRPPSDFNRPPQNVNNHYYNNSNGRHSGQQQYNPSYGQNHQQRAYSEQRGDINGQLQPPYHSNHGVPPESMPHSSNQYGDYNYHNGQKR